MFFIQFFFPRFIVCCPNYDWQEPKAQLLVRFEHQYSGVLEKHSKQR